MPDELVTIGRYSTGYEASLVRGALESFGIESVLADADTVRIDWMLSNALGGVKVQVRESEVQEALGILAAEPESPPEEQGAEEDCCPSCGSRNTRYLLDKRGTFLTWLVFGLPLMPAVPKRICQDCGTKWRT